MNGKPHVNVGIVGGGNGSGLLAAVLAAEAMGYPQTRYLGANSVWSRRPTRFAHNLFDLEKVRRMGAEASAKAEEKLRRKLAKKLRDQDRAAEGKRRAMERLCIAHNK